MANIDIQFVNHQPTIFCCIMVLEIFYESATPHISIARLNKESRWNIRILTNVFTKQLKFCLTCKINPISHKQFHKIQESLLLKTAFTFIGFCVPHFIHLKIFQHFWNFFFPLSSQFVNIYFLKESWKGFLNIERSWTVGNSTKVFVKCE